LLGRFVDKRLQQAGTRFKRITTPRLILGASLVLAALSTWGGLYYYNKFLMLQSAVAGARSQIIVQLQRRKDIVAELTNVVLAYAKHEKEIFEHAVDTRREIMRPAPGGSAPETPPASPHFPLPIADPAMSKLLAVAEGFPGLRLSENYQRLMDALVEAETKLAEHRMLLNAQCNAMDTELVLFPGVVFNWVLRFKEPAYYIADEDVHAPIRLELTPPSSAAAQRTEPHGEDGHE
jgi:LemA protein